MPAEALYLLLGSCAVVALQPLLRFRFGVNAALDAAVIAAVANDVVVAVAAANSNADACNFSPARAPAGARDPGDDERLNAFFFRASFSRASFSRASFSRASG